MALSLNKIQLIGNLGGDAGKRFTTDNVVIISFSIATTESHKDKAGNWVNETTWHNCTAFNLSDYFFDKLKKGTKIYIEGRIKKNEYTDKQGIKRYSVDVIVNKIIPLDKSEAERIDSNTNSGNNEELEDDLPF